MSRAYTSKNVYDLKPARFVFDGLWLDVLGAPEKRGVWLIFGKDKNGKSWGTLMLCDYLSKLEKVLFISAEQGLSGSFQECLQRAGISPSNKNINYLPFVTLAEVRKRLKRRGAAKIVVFDNLSFYTDEMNSKELKSLLADFPNTVFILLAHEEKGKPYTAVAQFALKIAEIIIHIKGLAMLIAGRCPGGNLMIDEEKSILYHGQSITKSA